MDREQFWEELRSGRFVSTEDKSITLRIMVAASAIDVNVLDHIIIGESYYSMADEGLIKTMKKQFDTFMKGV